MEIIHELEPEPRGVYGGAVGYISYSGNMDLAATEAACPTEFSNVVSCCMATPTACQ